MYNLIKKGKVLKTGTLEDCIYFLCSIESNIFHSLAYKGYKIFDENKKVVDVDSETKNKIEHQYRKDLYLKRVEKIRKIISSLNMQQEITQNEDKKHYYPDNINIYATDINKNEVRFSMAYNNKNKITISNVLKRNKDNISVYSEIISISFSFDKDLQKIKKDIEKRFISKWDVFLKEEKEKINKSNNYIDDTFKNMEYLKGEALTQEEKRSKTLYPSKSDIRSINIYGKGVKLELYSVTVEQAKRLIDVLQ